MKATIQQVNFYNAEKTEIRINVTLNGEKNHAVIHTVYAREQVQEGAYYDRAEWEQIRGNNDVSFVEKPDGRLYEGEVSDLYELEAFIDSGLFDDKIWTKIIRAFDRIIDKNDYKAFKV